MSSWLDYTINGLIVGNVYALVAVGLALIFGVSRLINFAQGSIYLVGAYVGWVAVERLRTPLIVTILLVVAVSALVGVIVERFGLPITATAANLQGASECTHAACVRDQIGDRIPLIVDGGPTGRSLPTTIVDLSLGNGRWEILREGAIPTHEIVMVLQR